VVIGIELIKNSKGKNSGHVDGIKYFECKPSKGLFVKPVSILKAEKPKEKGSVMKKKIEKRGAK